MSRRLWATVIAVVLALNVGLWLVQGGVGAAFADRLGNLFGPKMVRAEVVVKDASGVHAYRVDRGRITALVPATRTLTIRERDDTIVTVTLAPTARIVVRGANTQFSSLRRRMLAETVREGDGPVLQITAGA